MQHPDAVKSISHIHKETLCFIINISQGNFTMCKEHDVLKIEVYRSNLRY